MTSKKRGRKIKHSRKIYKRKSSLLKRFLTVFILLVVLAGLGFLGYSIAPPLFKFVKQIGKADNASSVSSWTPPVTSKIDSSSTADSSKTDVVKTESAVIFNLSPQAVLSEQSLKDALTSAKNKGFKEVSVTLKAQGGEVYFNTQNAVAVRSKAIKGTLALADIVRIIKENQLTPVAEMSILYDNISPKADYLIGYKFENENSMWLDANPQAGGKPWMSPFSDPAKAYITQLTDEITAAGFTKLVVSDVIFPTFRGNDLNYIGAVVKDPNRHTALTSMVNLIKSRTDLTKAQTLLKASALDIVSGNSEVFVPAELAGIDFIVQIDIAKLPPSVTLKDQANVDLSKMSVYDKTKTLLSKSAESAAKNKVIPSVDVTGLSEQDAKEVLRAITDLGYKDYIIRQ